MPISRSGPPSHLLILKANRLLIQGAHLFYASIEFLDTEIDRGQIELPAPTGSKAVNCFGERSLNLPNCPACSETYGKMG